MSHSSYTLHIFDIVPSNIWDLAFVISHARYKYLVTFIDDYSHFIWVYFLCAKSKAFSGFQAFLVLIDNQFSSSIKILRSDSRGEFTSNVFQSFIQTNGIISQ